MSLPVQLERWSHFPAAVAWHFEWRADENHRVAWSFWLMLALGAAAGAGWAFASGFGTRAGTIKWICLAVLLAPYITLPLFAAIAWWIH